MNKVFPFQGRPSSLIKVTGFPFCFITEAQHEGNEVKIWQFSCIIPNWWIALFVVEVWSFVIALGVGIIIIKRFNWWCVLSMIMFTLIYWFSLDFSWCYTDFEMKSLSGRCKEEFVFWQFFICRDKVSTKSLINSFF